MKEEKDIFLAKWLNGELSKEELEAFQASEDFEIYSKIVETSGKMKTPFSPKEQSWMNIQSKTLSKPKSKTIIWQKSLSIAASILVILGVFYFFNNQNQVYKTGYGQLSEVNLPDNSRVEMNSKTEIKFNKSNWENGVRTLTLNGAAFFDVEKGSKFTVETNKGKVQVLGTQFNVNTFGESLEVTCSEGSVKVIDRKNKELILKPGEGARIIDATYERWDFKPKSINRTANESYFYNSSLLKVLLVLENTYNLTIKNKSHYKNKRFTGHFSHNNKEVALKTVLEAMEIKYSVNKNTVILQK